ncbi:unnamed protein product [Mytilus coruscus]|uniref:Reverse transcriptase domain-containing protein n=1 Tax=Mytilus coruscus TaxID=42192 RepID=A0A6J8BA81_MYTCO|nr:unnamed protein product [Mytilus coruscus]
MRQASKEHKITLNKAFANYQQKAADELRNNSKKDAKALWKILNNLNDSKKKDNNDDISLKALYDHFKILNENVEPENDFEQDFDFETLSDDVELFLNSPVTEDEIKKVVSNLKNGKASGGEITASEVHNVTKISKCGKAPGVDDIPVKLYENPTTLNALTRVFKIC